MRAVTHHATCSRSQSCAEACLEGTLTLCECGCGRGTGRDRSSRRIASHSVAFAIPGKSPAAVGPR
eukprot:354140-Chlamydomonas_euryale.AAC.1